MTDPKPPLDELAHFGVKGMKWGVRKDRSSQPKVQGLIHEPIVRKTKNGDEFTLEPIPPGKISNFLASRNKSYRSSIEASAQLKIKDKDGKEIGNAQIFAESKKELNLVWLDIDRGARGQGYAQAVMRSAVEIGTQKGFEKLTLEVPGVSPDARHIYEKNGFRVVKEPTTREKKDVWGGLTHMELNLKRKEVSV